MESTQVQHHVAWNKGKLVGQKAPFKLKEIWSIRVRLEIGAGCGNSPCSNSVSIASCALAIFYN